MNADSTAAIERGVLAILGGTPLHQAAAQIPLDPRDLADAVQTYKAAGSAALTAQATGWLQAHIQFTDWASAETIAAHHLWPRLRDIENELAARWWFIRKAPCWRLRLQPGPDACLHDLRSWMKRTLDDLAALNLIRSWRETVYEPETGAFGGTTAMDIAHDLFHADSRAVLDHVGRIPSAETRIGRRELSVLLCSALMRGAGQDWYEQGDIWARVTHHRPLPENASPDQVDAMKPSLRLLMTADTFHHDARDGLKRVLDWMLAFGEAGAALAAAAEDGLLERGIRDIIAHHILFSANRLGLSASTQGILSRAARYVVLEGQ